MKVLKKAPIVNLNTDVLIKELVGEYNEKTQDVIHAIAKSETEILIGCNTLIEYKERMSKFIKNVSSKIS